MELNKEQLWDLRCEIRLCSIYYADYRNSFHIEEHACCDYFDGYADFLQELMNEDGLDGSNDFFELLDTYDTADNLYEWELCHDDDSHFPIDMDWVETEFKDDVDDALLKLVYSYGWNEKDNDTRYNEIMGKITKIVDAYETTYPGLKGKDWFDEVRTEKVEEYIEYFD